MKHIPQILLKIYVAMTSTCYYWLHPLRGRVGVLHKRNMITWLQLVCGLFTAILLNLLKFNSQKSEKI